MWERIKGLGYEAEELLTFRMKQIPTGPTKPGEVQKFYDCPMVVKQKKK